MTHDCCQSLRHQSLGNHVIPRPLRTTRKCRQGSQRHVDTMALCFLPLSLGAGQWLIIICSTVCSEYSGPQAEARWGQSLATRGLVAHPWSPHTHGILTPSDAQAEKSREFLHPYEGLAQKAGGEGESEQGQGLKCAFRRCDRRLLDMAGHGKTAQAQRSNHPFWEAAFWRAET